MPAGVLAIADEVIGEQLCWFGVRLGPCWTLAGGGLCDSNRGKPLCRPIGISFGPYKSSCREDASGNRQW